MTPALLEVDAASFRYRGARDATGPFSFSLADANVMLATGSSGAGKSTLARLCCGIIPHLYRGKVDGQVRLAGRRTTDVPLWQVTETAGLVGQNPAAQLVASTVAQEVAFGLDGLGLSRADTAARIDDALAWAGLADRIHADPRDLSGGEQQRLLIAASTARGPRVLVLDEPLSMLDAASGRRIVEMLEVRRERGAASLVFEHRVDLLEGLSGLERLSLGESAGAGGYDGADVTVEVPDFDRSFSVAVQGLTVRRDRLLLNAIDLDLRGGSVVALRGPNGSGKTTLLRVLAGLETDVEGRVEGPSGRCPRLGLAFQNPDLQIFNATVREEVVCGLPSVDEERYGRVAAALGLDSLEARPPLLLSEGQKKRLGIATILMRDGLDGVLLDEPTLGQDPFHRRRIGRLARALADAGALVIAATHDEAWARSWADREVVLERGRVVGDGPSAPEFEKSPALGDRETA